MKREWVSWVIAAVVGFGVVAVEVQLAEMKAGLAEMRGRVVELEAGQAGVPIVRAVPEPDLAPVAPTDRGGVKEGTMGTWDGQVGHSLDDACCEWGEWYADAGAVAITNTGEDDHGWLRFLDVPVPQGAVIIAAYLRFCAADDFPFESGTYCLRAQDEDNAGVVASCAEFVAKPWTTAYLESSFEPWSKDVWYPEIPDTSALVDIVQEIVSREGWVAGNALAFGSTSLMADEHGSYAYDADPTKAVKLHIEWRPSISTEDTAVVGDSLRLGLRLSDSLVVADSVRLGLRLSDTLVLGEDVVRIVNPCQGRAVPGQPCPRPEKER